MLVCCDILPLSRPERNSLVGVAGVRSVFSTHTHAYTHLYTHTQTIRRKHKLVSIRRWSDAHPYQLHGPTQTQGQPQQHTPWWTLELIRTSKSFKGCVTWVGWKTDRKRRERERDRGREVTWCPRSFSKHWIGSHWSLENPPPFFPLIFAPYPSLLSTSSPHLLLLLLLLPHSCIYEYIFFMPEIVKGTWPITKLKLHPPRLFSVCPACRNHLDFFFLPPTGD